MRTSVYWLLTTDYYLLITMTSRLRVGVIGLGRRWRRYRETIAELREHLEVRGVCDHVARRAERAARQVGCPRAAGPVDLLERDDVEAVLLLDRQWFGLWPLELACRAGKPVFLAVSSALDGEDGGALHRLLREHPVPVVAAMTSAVAPTVSRLRALLAERLGPARVVRWDASGGPMPPGAGPLRTSALLPALHVCRELLGVPPVDVWTVAPEGAGFVSVTLGASGGQVAQVTVTAGGPPAPACRIAVAAERGFAAATLPRRLRWRDADGEHALRSPSTPLRRELLLRFVAAARGGQSPSPNFEDVSRALSWLRAARRSHAEGRRVTVGDVEGSEGQAGQGNGGPTAPGPS
jgi:predicted dehydrogenase